MSKFEPPNRIDPGHEQTRGIFRTVGPLVAGAGALLTAVGLFSFFNALGTFEPPRYFWCAILGLPTFGLGLMITKIGFLGSILRYMSGEMAPVSRDTFNTMADETAPGVRTLAEALGQGIGSGIGTMHGAAEVTCPKCAAANARAARFCGHCGASLEPRACPRCGQANEGGSRFCSQCGGQLVV